MITLEDVSLQVTRASGFWRRDAYKLLDNINFSVSGGTVSLLVGGSASGKTLLARGLLRILPDDVRMTGTYHAKGPRAYLPQARSHLDPLAPVARQITRAGLPDAGLPFSGRYPHQISGGEAKRALMAMMPDAASVIADEPTAGLDPAAARIVMSELAARAKDGAAVLVITHDLMTTLPFAQEVLLLDQGRLAAHHATAAFTADGAALSPAARRYWRALPENGFHAD